ncbi:hypothetical protein GCM10011583_61990 [Streptomyces camponoticapitis]|uniref:Uncharacterized protein n=1 Tax=Streptomyces camponoticapitis TaxID=1616125 RepID=A0ABQ2ETN3_9ACTN|nr:hypothetical protein GCM10011583_61990 [Streptomyces camponoticapitis]
MSPLETVVPVESAEWAEALSEGADTVLMYGSDLRRLLDIPADVAADKLTDWLRTR